VPRQFTPSPTPRRLVIRPKVFVVRLALLVFGLGPLASLGCSAIVRDPNFRGARDQVADATLLGPFDGQVLDETTLEPISSALVVAIWSYDEGEAWVGPAGSSVTRVKTDAAGRYKVPRVPAQTNGDNSRLVSFHLVVYKRGYVGYRSDAVIGGQGRHDFVQRHNRVLLRKWREADSHAEHLLFLSAPPDIELLTRWEREAANLDLYRQQSGEEYAALLPGGPQEPVNPTAGPIVLDARELLPPTEVRRRTSYAEAFTIKELGDLARTVFYHGVHLQAVDRDETWDLAYRVWRDPPGGLQTVQETFEATLPGVVASPDITPQTWIYDGELVRAVAFLDQERNVGVLLTCGASQCADIETAIILASFIHGRLDQLKTEVLEVAAP